MLNVAFFNIVRLKQVAKIAFNQDLAFNEEDVFNLPEAWVQIEVVRVVCHEVHHCDGFNSVNIWMCLQHDKVDLHLNQFIVGLAIDIRIVKLTSNDLNFYITEVIRPEVTLNI